MVLATAGRVAPRLVRMRFLSVGWMLIAIFSVCFRYRVILLALFSAVAWFPFMPFETVLLPCVFFSELRIWSVYLGTLLERHNFLLDSDEHSLVCIPVLPRFIVPWLIAVGGCRLLRGFCIPAFWFLLTLWTCDYAGECDVRSMFQNTWQCDLFLKTKLCNVDLCSVVYVILSELVFTFGGQYINLPVCFHLCLWPDPYNVSQRFSYESQ